MNQSESSSSHNETVNVSERLRSAAQSWPDRVAVAFPTTYSREKTDSGEVKRRRNYQQVTFAQLESDVERIAKGVVAMGVEPGTRLALLVRPSIDFIALTFGLLRSGAVPILIDPGMGRKNLLGCLDASQPKGFIAIPPVHAVRVLLGRRYRDARFNVTVGRRWFWSGHTLESLRTLGEQTDKAPRATMPDDPAAIIFTTGSTGPPKGVLYRHENFDAQVQQIQSFYQIQPGEVDLPGFPLFGLFNAAMGVTTVIPDMDPSRPAQVDPRKILEAARDWKITQAFGSPAIWNRVGQYCEESGDQIETLRRVLSAGAPVPAHVLRRMSACIHPEGQIHTPYGATESLPVASISSIEVLSEATERTDQGDGVCVGRRFPEIDWKVIRIVDGPIETLEQVEELPQGEIGELIVSGPQVTREYATRTEWNAKSKIADEGRVWHRIGDCGYFDEQHRFWFCGRVAHRVLTPAGPMYPVQCEAIINTHPEIFRSALVGVGPKGEQRPVIVVERAKLGTQSAPKSTLGAKVEDPRLVRGILELAAKHKKTAPIRDVLIHDSLPVDIRHNAKIFREKLSVWATDELKDDSC